MSTVINVSNTAPTGATSGFGSASTSGSSNMASIENLLQDVEQLLQNATGSTSQGNTMPGASQTGGMPSMSGMPSMPSMSGMPSMPSMSGMPSMPGMSGMSQTGSMQSPSQMSGMSSGASALPTGNDLTQIGTALQQGGAQQAMSDFKNNDPAAFETFQNQLSTGNGNAATQTLATAIQSGKVSQGDGAAIGAQLQQTANSNGGGVISDSASQALQTALGGQNVLATGHMRSVGQVVSQAMNKLSE